MAGSVADDNPDMVRMGDGADGVWKAGVGGETGLGVEKMG